MNDLIDLIAQEGNFHPSEELIKKLLNSGEETRFAPKTPVIEYGHINNNIYIVKNGILRLAYYEGAKEITYGFATPGTIFLSPYSYYLNCPAAMQIETCRKNATCIVVPKSRFDALISDSHEFARWMFNLAIGQFCTCEKKLQHIKGNARERIMAILKYRPEIVKEVTTRIFASYIGVTESYLCRIRKKMK